MVKKSLIFELFQFAHSGVNLLYFDKFLNLIKMSKVLKFEKKVQIFRKFLKFDRNVEIFDSTHISDEF